MLQPSSNSSVYSPTIYPFANSSISENYSEQSAMTKLREHMPYSIFI